MARKSKVLWGKTRYREWVIPIYKVRGAFEDSHDAWTQASPARGKLQEAEICVQSFVFRETQRLDETLIHEFIHVIEYAVGRRNLGHRLSDANCTKSAEVLGEGLAQMLRELRQANLIDKPHTKPRKR